MFFWWLNIPHVWLCVTIDRLMWWSFHTSLIYRPFFRTVVPISLSLTHFHLLKFMLWMLLSFVALHLCLAICVWFLTFSLFLLLFSCSRFVLNVPKEDQQSFERILFLVEYAHWFYEDNSVENNPSLKSFTLKEFTSLSILISVYFRLCFQ